MTSWISWRNFWIFWIGGLIIFAAMVVTGNILTTDVAPEGMLDHQSAGTAEQVNAIQQSWLAAGVLNSARWGMIADLLFIGLYTVGGIIGGRLIWQYAYSPTLKKLGLFLILTYFLFGLSDYTETILQFIQLLRFEGNDLLAGIAAFAKPIKMVTFSVGTLTTVATLLWYRLERHA